MSAMGESKTENDADAMIRVAADGQPVLRGGRCPQCRTPHFPKQPVCPVCAGEKVVIWDMPRYGTLYSFSVLNSGKDGAPRAFGYVDLPNNVRVFTRLKGIDYQIGQKVFFALDDARTDNEPPYLFTAEAQ